MSKEANFNKEEFDESSERLESMSIEEMYVKYRESFLAFGKKMGGNKEDVLDMYQDAIIVLMEHLYDGKLQSLGCSIKTYLFSIGKHKLLNQFKRSKKTAQIMDEKLIDLSNVLGSSKVEEMSDRQQMILSELDRIGEKCKEIIELFYYKRFSIEAIRISMGYASDNAVKVSKSNCIKKIKDKMRS